MKDNTEPIRTVLVPLALIAFIAAAQAFIAGADTRGILTAVLGALIVAAQEIARKYVTPLAKLAQPALPAPVSPPPPPPPPPPRRRTGKKAA